MDTHDTQTDIAEHLDMSTANFRDFCKRLEIDWRQHTKEEFRVIYIRHLRKVASGHDDSLAAARTRREMAEAKLKEMELAEKLGQVICIADVEPLMIDFMKQVQAACLESGQRIIAALESAHDVRVDDDLIFGPLRGILGNLAARGDQLVARVSGEPCASVSSAADAADPLGRAEHQAARGQ